MSCNTTTFTQDVESLAELVNEDKLVTTRYGDNPKKSWLYLQGEFEAAIPYTPAGDFATGFTYTSTNQVGLDGSGNYWIYNGSVPFVVAPGTVPSAPDYTQVVFADHNALNNRNAVGAHGADAIDWSGYSLTASQIAANIDYIIDNGVYFDKSSQANNKRLNSENKMISIAHRGYASSNVENTILALESAIRNGADALEIDISVTSDGVPYCFHDITLDNLTDGTGNFVDTPAATINTLKFDQLVGTEFYDTMKIPQLLDVIRLCERLGAYVYAEIKNISSNADITTIMGMYESNDAFKNTLFMSSRIADIQFVKANYPTAKLGLVGSASSGYEADFDWLAQYRESEVVWDATVLLNNPAVYSYAVSKGLTVNAYTPNTHFQAEALMQMGINRMITDVPLTGAK